ncbi:ClpXP protease specificity-enhancing factor [Psychrosphaera sp. F3M07]|jgi:stringent starvation protein B|uniref:ClpXP protease specificity-enhancing factor n=1 Tax=Psychrosphaera sp. F3M07 TaxID=2841560 RepID=UPI001C0A30A1|nr:ClpXP protease specificity-enhancing factor [Psychrosphaera sp. F3M07]MBU2919176.1 ClpXP protease specificity-enhancing factor [Psychrosphaera sp. F3M07]
MSSNRPYLLKAFYDWILDNECTPYIVVEADMPHVAVPQQTVKDGQVVLNISPSAVQMFQMDKQQITFSARFGGVPFEVYIPIYAISAIYARENGAGTMFPPEEFELEDVDLDDDNTPHISAVESDIEEPKVDVSKDDKKPKKGSHLSIVK